MNIKDEIAANEILRNIQDKFETQTEKGIAKYGHTVRPESLSVLDWINHTQEECLEQAYNVICGRTGRMVNGVFVKEEDLKNATVMYNE